MSHTTRRRKDHTAHARGRFRQALASAEQVKHRRAAQAKAPAEPPRVTDHALIRWLERVLGVDVRSRIEAEMLADGRDDLIRCIGSGRIRINGTRTVLIVRDGCVTSVVIEGANHG